MASDGAIKISTELDSAQAEKAMSKFGRMAKTGLKGITVAAAAAWHSNRGHYGICYQDRHRIRVSVCRGKEDRKRNG